MLEVQVTRLELYVLKILSRPLSSNSKAVLLLRKTFGGGGITDDDDPKLVWLSEPVFKENKLGNFRSRFNKQKKELLVENCKCFHFTSFIEFIFTT